MSELEKIKFNDFQGWIPETDIDGIDTNNIYLADAINADFENGFIYAANAPEQLTLNLAIASEVANGYSIISTKSFVHSTRGLCIFYILYKSANNYKFYIAEGLGSTATELIIHDYNPTYVTNPSIPYPLNNLNYQFSNNKLYINTNVTATILSKSVLLNLVLYYNDYSYYNRWELTPRWLGWLTNDSTNLFLDNGLGGGYPPTTEIDEVFGLTVPYWVNGSSIYQITKYSGYWRTSSTIGYFYTIKLYNVKKIRIRGTSPTASDSISIGWTRDTGYGFNVLYEDYSDAEGVNRWFDFDINILGGAYLYITLKNNFILNEIEIISFDKSEFCIMGYFHDGQFALINKNDVDDVVFPDLYHEMVMRSYVWSKDLRITEYIVYVKIGDLYYRQFITVPFVDWSADSVGGTNWQKVVVQFDCLLAPLTSPERYKAENTLNFDYGLGSTVRVDTQHLIYSETIYRNRVYLVNGCDKVFQSHIAGNGKLRQDSFPYSEENNYGYFIAPCEDVLKSIVVTPLDELLIIGDKNSYVYYIQASNNIPYKHLQAVNSNVGIGWYNAIAKTIDGYSAFPNVLWANQYGIYLYSGNLNEPIDVSSKAAIKNWWLNSTNSYDITSYVKDNIIIGYYRQKNEIWIVDGTQSSSQTILIYEINFGRFKKYKLGIRILEFIGEINNELYMLAANNKIYKYSHLTDRKYSRKLIPYIESHYSAYYSKSNENKNRSLSNNEDEYKILQEINVSNNNLDNLEHDSHLKLTIGAYYRIVNLSEVDDMTFVGAAANENGVVFAATAEESDYWDETIVRKISAWEIRIYADGNLSQTSTMFNDRYLDKILAIRNLLFRKIKIALTVASPYSDARASIREFSFTFNSLIKGLGQ